MCDNFPSSGFYATRRVGGRMFQARSIVRSSAEPQFKHGFHKRDQICPFRERDAFSELIILLAPLGRQAV